MPPRPSYMNRAPRMAPLPSRAFTLPLPARRRLAGGLGLLHLRRDDLPLAHVTLLLQSGVAQDPPDQPGAAFFTAALVDEGAGGRSALELAGALQQLGTSLHISVDAESTSLSMELTLEHVEPAMELLADVLCRPHLRARDLSRVRREIVGRCQQRLWDPSQAASLALSAALFGDHPYGRPALPALDHARQISLPRVTRFHREHYRPNNALVVVTGAPALAPTERLLRRLLAGWRPGGPRPRRAVVPRPPAAVPPLVLVDRPGAVESTIRVGNRLPARRQVDVAGSQLLNTILGGSFTSRLNLNLRERHGYTYGVSSSFTPMRQHGLLSIGAQVERDNTVAALLEVRRELRRLRQRPVGQRELDKARALVVEDLPASAETLAGVADAYLDLAQHRESLARLNQLPRALARIDGQQLQRLARELILPREMCIVVLGDLRRLRPQLEQHFGAAQLRDPEGRVLAG